MLVAVSNTAIASGAIVGGVLLDRLGVGLSLLCNQMTPRLACNEPIWSATCQCILTV